MKTIRKRDIGGEIANIVAAIYSDISDICQIRKVHLSNQGLTGIYSQECQEVDLLMSRIVTQYLDPNTNAEGGHPNTGKPGTQRLLASVPNLGWKLIAICAYSGALRRACEEADDVLWKGVVGQIDANRSSIEIFARIQNLDWRGPLLIHARHLQPDLQHEFAPYRKLHHEHPHHYVHTTNGELRWPMYECHRQRHIDACAIDIRDWKGKGYRRDCDIDPTRRQEKDGVCELCFRNVECDCRSPVPARHLVELREYPTRGVGVRALANFKKGDILDEFVGQIVPTYTLDPKYAIIVDSEKKPEDWVFISPKRLGNWTRFINHSCDASTEFKRMTIGDRVVVNVVAIRDIFIFEEITADYGEDYWESRECQCGTSNCLRVLKTMAAKTSLSSPPVEDLSE